MSLCTTDRDNPRLGFIRGDDVTRRWVIAGLAGTGALLLAGCEMFTARYRFRMIVEVDTPRGLRTGSSVLEATAAEQPIRIGDYAAKTIKLRGEAVAVDIAGNRKLFALLDENWPSVVARLFIPKLSNEPRDFVNGFATLGGEKMRGQKKELPRAAYPKLVRFRDIRDPKSVEAVDPDDLGAWFGVGVKLMRISAQITADPITIQIEKMLPPYDQKGFFNWDGASNPNLDGVVGIWDFMRGGE